MSNYTMHEVEGYNGTRYESEDGRMVAILSVCDHDRTDRHDLMNIWRKKGLTGGRFIDRTIHLDVYYTDDDGNTLGIFNPYHLSVPGRCVINFDRLFEDTPYNRLRLVAEAAAMRRDGVRSYDAAGWTSCAISPDCIA